MRMAPDAPSQDELDPATRQPPASLVELPPRARRNSGESSEWSLESAEPKRLSLMTEADIELCQQLDQDYDRAIEEREIAYAARYNSVRQSACFSVLFMVVYLSMGTVFFMRQASWNVRESLFFSICTITTVGYGNLENPDTPAFQLYVVFFIFIGIATLTIMVAQVYQCVLLEAARAQHARDQSELVRRHASGIVQSRSTRQQQQQQQQYAENTTAEIVGLELHRGGQVLDRILSWLERLRHFLQHNQYGRGISVLVPFASLILIGAAVIGTLEGWTPVEAVYFAVVSLTTVGFGDYYPTEPAAMWFCILWLPFSVGFMSLFLANVARFYIQLSDKNIERIERHLRTRVQKRKRHLEREKQAALKRALRGQETKENETEQAEETVANTTPAVVKVPRAVRKSGFNTVPHNDEDFETHAPEQRRNERQLFGSLESPTTHNRRGRILRHYGMKPTHSSITTMRHILDRVQHNLTQSFPESEFLTMRSTDVMYQQHDRSRVRKPSFALRVLVQERFAEIIATEVAGYESHMEIHDTTLKVTIDNLKATADKWLVPRRARKAFRAVAFEALYFVGEHGLITRGAQALFELSPFEFHGLFAPLLAALGDAETMEGWLESTKVLADVELRRKANGGENLKLSASHSLSDDDDGGLGIDEDDDNTI